MLKITKGNLVFGFQFRLCYINVINRKLKTDDQQLRLKAYLIKKGKHYSGLHFRPHCGKTEIEFDARFDRTALYFLKQTPGQINKLFGISWGFHHHCSARVGWRSDGQKIELFSYVYTYKNHFEHRAFGFVRIDQLLHFKISRENEKVFVEHNSTVHEYTVAKPRRWGYYLFPYFGGDERAPRDVVVEVQINAG